MKGTTSSGFNYEIDPEIVKDYEYLELAAKSQKNGLLFPDLVEYSLGEKQKDTLVAHLKGLHGKALTQDMAEEYAQIIGSLAEKDPEVKN